METVTSLASSASRAIWGDQTTRNETNGREPIAGETGDVNAGEPYDKGNLDGAAEDTTDAPLTSNNSSSIPEPSTVSENPSSTLPGNTAPTGPTRPEHDTYKPTSSNDTSSAGPTPFVGADPPSGTQNTQKQQGAGRPFDELKEGSEEHERINKTKEEAEEGGKAGGEEEDGPQKESHGEGTSEKYIESSGLKADGGDFDAANTGAAREADRLLEEKGTPGTAPRKEGPDTQGKNGKEGKVSLKDKIKAKLHKH